MKRKLRLKTYEEFRNAIMDLFETPISAQKIEDLAAKEYAKQWIDKAANIGRMYGGLEIQKAIDELKFKIDAQ